MLFADSLRAELGKDNHAGILITSPSWDGIYVVDLKGSAPVLRVCVAHESEDKCSCWTCDLSDEIILNHMEEDVGIFDAEGLPAYASYFRDALVLGVAIEANGAFGGADTTVLFLVFQYAIGSALLEGRMKMKLAQESICLDVYSMMKLIYNFDPLRKISVGTRLSTATRKHKTAAAAASSSAVDGYGGAGTGDGEGVVAQDEELTVSDAESGAGGAASLAVASASAAAKAKKRRVGGVNIFPGMRKK